MEQHFSYFNLKVPKLILNLRFFAAYRPVGRLLYLWPVLQLIHTAIVQQDEGDDTGTSEGVCRKDDINAGDAAGAV